MASRIVNAIFKSMQRFKATKKSLLPLFLRRTTPLKFKHLIPFNAPKFTNPRPTLLLQNLTAFLKSLLISIRTYLNELTLAVLDFFRRTFGEGFVYLRGLFIVFSADALIVDDEPLWEPIEWSMVQAWILFIFFFAWIAENLIVSRYGSYTGRDKRVWFAWYKTFWLVDLWYVLSMGAAILFVITPYYYEINYLMSYVNSWWNWYSRVFFFKMLASTTLMLLVAQVLQLNLRWFNWKQAFSLILIINFFFAYLLYTHFFMAFFSYFTHVNWYNSTRMTDYVQLSHEPGKWGWGARKRDHFSYHKSSTVFWFKNDGPFAAAFLFLHFLFFASLFLTFLYWAVLLRRIYTTQDFTYTYTIYAVSSLKQFYYLLLLFYLFVFMSFIISYWRFPIEFIWITNSHSWLSVFFSVLYSYPGFLASLL